MKDDLLQSQKLVSHTRIFLFLGFALKVIVSFSRTDVLMYSKVARLAVALARRLLSCTLCTMKVINGFRPAMSHTRGSANACTNAQVRVE